MTNGSFPQSAQAVVVGGGIVGLSVLYHLARMGWKDIVLVEKNELTSGTTWHSAALVSQLRGTHAQTKLAQYSSRLYDELKVETGVETGMVRNGHFNLATSPDRLEEIKQALTLARLFGVEAHMVGRDEVERRWPLMNTDDVACALWTPSTGRGDPSNICQAFAKGARARGARIVEHVAVTGIARQNGRVSAVETSQGRIETPVVINCAGLWGREMAALAGLRAPLFACEHFYLLTEKIEGIAHDVPLFRDGDAHLYVREEVGGLLVGCFEPNPKPLPVKNLPKDAAYILLNEDWDHFAPMMEGAIRRIPALETAGVRMLLNGPESFTHDNAPLMGEAPGLPGFWFCCGMNSAGVAMGGGAGWATAEWIVNGKPPVDLSGCDVKRFPAVLDCTAALAERIPEVLSHHFSVRYPGREMQSARGVRRSPLHDRFAERGAYFAARSGWEKAQWFDPKGETSGDVLRFGRPAWQHLVEAECAAVRGGVALFDQSSFGKFRVQGRDAATFLQAHCAADIDRPGSAVYTAVLNDDGGFESDLTVTRLADDEFLVITGTAQTDRDLAYFRSRIGERFVTVTDVTSGLSTLLLTGPEARAALARVTETDLSTAAFPFAAAREIEVGYARALAVRMSFAGEIGWELHLPSETVQSVWESLLAAAPGIVPAGGIALNVSRLEKGFRSWGHDIGLTDTPLEAGMGFAVAWDKVGGFRGREALLRQREAGLKRRLVLLGFDGDAWPSAHHAIYRDGTLAGEVTSAATSPMLGRAVGLGWIETGGMGRDDLLSDRFEVEVNGERYDAELTLSAPYDPKGERLRQ